MEGLILIKKDDLKSLILETLNEFEYNKQERLSEAKLYTVNQTRKILGIAHSTLQKMIDNGIIKATPNRRISEKSLNQYLENKINE